MPFILAIDYDGTLFEGVIFENDHPSGGFPVQLVIVQAKEFKKYGAELILWTCREGGILQEALNRCKQFGLEFDAVNSNAPSQAIYMQAALKNQGAMFAHRKIFADIYVDDRSPGSIEHFLKMNAQVTCANYKIEKDR